MASPMIVLVLALFVWSWFVHVIIMDADLFTDGALELVVPDIILW